MVGRDGGEGIELINTVPSAMSELLRSGSVPASVGVVNLAGEALSKRLVEELYELGHVREVNNLYGPSEDTTYTTSGVMRRGEGERVTIGRPIANTRVYIVDERGEAVPVGVAGEIWIGGAGLARGYMNRPEVTAEKFVPEEMSGGGGERVYRTGDMGRYLSNGEIEFLGRRDEQVKIRGYRIEPGEVEAVLAGHGQVREAVVVARSEGGGEKRLVGYVVREAAGSGLNASELRSYLKERLPEYMVPGAWVMLDELPRTPNGKIDRRALPEPGKFGSESMGESTVPRDIIELRLLEIWENGFDVRPIGIADNFFDLGGHSLLAIRITSDIQKEFNIHLPLNLFFQETTVERLARIIRGEVGAIQESLVVPIQTRGSKPPFFCVHPGSGTVFHYAALARLLGSDQPFYGLQDPILYEGGDPDISLEERASRYVAALREIQPRGPYFLGGWSFGGHVAFQMAQHLKSQGEDVALLALLDTAAPSLSILDSADDAGLLAVIMSELFSHHRDGNSASLQEMTDDLRRLRPDEHLSYARAKLREHSIPELRKVPVDFFLMLFKSRLHVVQRYTAQQYPGRITLILANEGAGSQDLKEFSDGRGDATRGWAELSTEPVDVYYISGNHSTICLEPHVEALAARLKFCLDKNRQVPAGANSRSEPIYL